MKHYIANTLALFSALLALWTSNFMIVSYNAANKAIATIDPVDALLITRELSMLKTLAMLGWIGYIYAFIVLFILFAKLIGWMFDPTRVRDQ